MFDITAQIIFNMLFKCQLYISNNLKRFNIFHHKLHFFTVTTFIISSSSLITTTAQETTEEQKCIISHDQTEIVKQCSD